MQTFQIERKPRKEPQKHIKADGRQFQSHGNKQKYRREQNAEQPVRNPPHGTGGKGRAKERDRVVQQSARRTDENADEENIKLAH